MKRGAWHQCGDKSQRLVREQLENAVGVGVVLSPRDLSLQNASQYSAEYRALDAEVLLDQQFYIPGFTNPNLDSYPISQHRAAVSSLNRIGNSELDSISHDLETISRDVGVSAVVAPAILYEAGRGDIDELNSRLFSAARKVGDSLGVPTLATVVLGRSVANSQQTLAPALSCVTSLSPDGWYFGFEFDAERIPSDRDAIARAGSAILTLACTGKPVLHAYAGPLSLLSLGFGATGTAIGHSQNTWRFAPERWQPSAGQGGGGNAPPRFFSSSLWGTLIYPDETVRLTGTLSARVMTHSPFSGAVNQNPPVAWSRWEANKHLIFLQGSKVASLPTNARGAASQAIAVLTGAVFLHGQIASTGIQLADETAAYQTNWKSAMEQSLMTLSSDYDYLELVL